jgi:hypothetical protein
MISLKYINPISVVFCILLSFVTTPSQSQIVYGCRDPYANNYNPSANVNDGSCTYNPTSYTPPIKRDPISDTLIESSGLQMAGNYLWSFNDGGGAAAIYRVDTTSGSILQTVNLGGATNVDWEDIAFDGTYFYVGDFGNNANGARTDLKIYKFPFSAIADYTNNTNVTIPANQIEIINFVYSDQVQPPVATSANNTKFDCEAMIVDGGKIHLFTKNWIDLNTTHYVIASTSAGTYTALPVETLATNYLVTAADKAPGQNMVVLLGYQNSGFGSHFLHLLSDYSTGLYFNGNKRRIDLPDATQMGQAEGISFRNATYGYISNEKFTRSSGAFTLTVNQKLRSFDINNFTPSYVLSLDLKEFSAVNVNGTHKLSWRFNSAVQNLQVEESTNGISFTNLKSYTSSTADVFYTQSSASVSYYRLVWTEADGNKRYSNTISIKSGGTKGIKNALLKRNGELKFTLEGNETSQFAFKLISAEGRILSQFAMATYNPGLNTIYFSKNVATANLVYLSIESDKVNQTSLLQVQK